MGKRWGGGGGRRPTLDLGDALAARSASEAADSSADAAAPAEEPAESNPLLGLMGEYGDDDDEGGATAGDEGSTDDKVAGFLAELEQQGLVADAGAAQDEARGTCANSAAAPNPWLVWRQCVDQATSATYFWNTETDEVCWTMLSQSST